MTFKEYVDEKQIDLDWMLELDQTNILATLYIAYEISELRKAFIEVTRGWNEHRIPKTITTKHKKTQG